MKYQDHEVTVRKNEVFIDMVDFTFPSDVREVKVTPNCLAVIADGGPYGIFGGPEPDWMYPIVLSPEYVKMMAEQGVNLV